MKKIKIFLASSNELKEDRDEFRKYISKLNDRLVDKKVYLEIIQWENFLDAISNTRLQDEYNEALRKADIALCLFFTKVGKYSEEEFDTAYKVFKATGKPKIWTYFKNAPVNSGSLTGEINTLLKFKEKIASYGHYITEYTSTADLHIQFRGQLDIVFPELIFPGRTSKKLQEDQGKISPVADPATTGNNHNKDLKIDGSERGDENLDKIDSLLDEPTEDNIKMAIDLLAKLTKNTAVAIFLITLRADFIQYKEEKLAGFNMSGRLNILLVRLRQIINEFKKSSK